MSEPFQLRDIFNEKLIRKISLQISKVYKPFPQDKFLSDLIPAHQNYSFGDRCSLITDALRKYLPSHFPTAVKILVKSLGPEPQTETFEGYDDFYIMPECLFVSRYGLSYFEESTEALYEMTKRLSAEMDIRPFLIRYPQETLAFLKKLTKDKSPYARRLASEGTRPRLPLGIRLPEFIKDPKPVILLLEKLKTDPNLMVRRSVANNINDISKDNPEIIIRTLKEWKKSNNPHIQWIMGHGTRTLIKQGNPGALKLMGYNPNVKLSIGPLKIIKANLKVGESLEFSSKLTNPNRRAVPCMIDFVIHFKKANGTLSPKVFKAFKKKLKPGEFFSFKKKHPLKLMTTRKLYTGTHALELQINGKRYSYCKFNLAL